MSFRVDVVTLFPEMLQTWLELGVVSRCINRSVVDVNLIDLRQFGLGRHLQVDDYPFGGGPGMVLRPEPIFAAVESIPDHTHRPVILMSPRGTRFSQAQAAALSVAGGMTLICGHYEGVDERVSQHLATQELSIGDYVLSGGELPAMCVIDAVVRLLPGAIDEQSTREESFTDSILEYPQYTRPASFRGWEVPEVLTSGHHARVSAWRREQAKDRTERSRPDLIVPEPNP